MIGCSGHTLLEWVKKAEVNSRQSSHSVRRFLATLRIGKDSAFVGKRLRDVDSSLPADIAFSSGPDTPIEDNARLGISGTHASLEEALRAFDATAAPRWLIDRIRADAAKAGEDISFVEMAIALDSRLIGLTLQTAGLEHVAVIGVDQARRFQHENRECNAEAPLAEGDVLLMMGTVPNLQAFAREDGLLMLEGAREMPRTAKALVALAIMGGSVALAMAEGDYKFGDYMRTGVPLVILMIVALSGLLVWNYGL